MLWSFKVSLVVILLIVSASLFIGSRFTGFFIYTTGSNSNLSIWDSTDPSGYYGSGFTKYADQQVYFYANFTNLTSGESVNGSGVSCNISFNISGSWTTPAEMNFTSSILLYEYNRSLDSKGNYSWNVTCDGSALGYNTLNVTDVVKINNSEPVVSGKDAGGNLPLLTCYEDTLCYYNFSSNCTDPDDYDVLTYSYVAGTEFSGFSINPTTGIVTINAVNDNQTGSKDVVLVVIDSSNASDTGTLPVNIIAVNDAPQFDPTLPQEMNVTEYEVFIYDVNATDEENNTPFYFNITFIAGNQIFNISHDTVFIIYSGDISDIGNYTINFSVTDSGSPNATSFTIVNFSVLNVNDPPNLSLIITPQNATQGQNFSLVANATDPDNDTLVFSTNYTAKFPITTNLTGYPGVSARGIMNYTPVNNSQVGNYSVNISVSDGSLVDWQSVVFVVYNINDPPVLTPIGNLTAVQNILFSYQANATDPDQDTPYNDTLYFWDNTTMFDIDQNNGLISFTPNSSHVGGHFINISVNDSGGLVDWEVINLTVVSNSPPIVDNISSPQNLTQNENFTLVINATDAENDTLTFSTNYTAKFPITTNLTGYPGVSARGIMNYTPVNNSQVGNYSVNISVTDSKGAVTNRTVVFVVYNVNDPPNLTNISDQSVQEDQNFYYDVNATDPDQDTPYNDTLYFWDNTTLFDINQNTGIINFTPDSSHVGNHSINISVNDSGGLLDWDTFTLSVTGINDPPFFYPPLPSSLNTTENQQFLYYVHASDEENNTPYVFNLSFISGNQIFNITQVNDTSGMINFTPNSSHIGNYTINFTVTDSGSPNATNFTVVNFTVFGINHAPQLNSWSVIPANQSIVENDTLIILINATDQDGDSLTCYWHKNETLNRTISSCQGTAGSLNYKSSFEDSGYWIFKVNISDDNLTTSMEWGITVTNKNRPPYLAYLIQNQKWNMNTDNSNINLSYNLRDPDNENNVTNDDNNLTYTNSNVSHISVSINQATGVVTLTPETDWYGVEYANFTVNDSEYTNTSNNVTLNVTYAETPVQQQTVTTGGGGGTAIIEETKTASMSITASGIKKITPNNVTTLTIYVENTGEVVLNDITLKARSSSMDLSVSLGDEYIPRLVLNETKQTSLTVKTYDLKMELYEINIMGVVTSPKLNQSLTIYLNVLASLNLSGVKKEMQLVKDLFQENPECLDLTELIVRAERELNEENLEKAKELTETALTNCRDLIRYRQNMTGAVTPREEKPQLFEIAVIILLLVLIVTVVYIFIERRAEKEFRKRKKGKKPKGTIIKT